MVGVSPGVVSRWSTSRFICIFKYNRHWPIVFDLYPVIGKAAKVQGNQEDKPSGAKPYSSPSRAAHTTVDSGVEPDSEVAQVMKKFSE